MPETPEKNAYEILGVSRTASTDDIKKRYRELARQYHPDVNQGNPGAAKLFAQITGAYKTLSDPNSRATYDADLLLKEKRQQAATARSASSTPRSTPSGNPTSAAATAQATAQRNVAEAQRFVGQAQAAFARGRFVEARSFAEQAMRLNRRNDKAYEILGDVYRLQAKTDEAINMYSMALQLNPRNPQVMQRLERLTKTTGNGPGPTAQRVFFDNSPRPNAAPPPFRPRPTPPVNAPRSPLPNNAYTPSGVGRHTLGLLTVGFMGYISVLLLIIYTALYPGAAPTTPGFLPMVSAWNGTIWTVLPLVGLILGFTMTMTGVIRRLEDELVFTGVSPSGGAFLPMGFLVILLSVINFYMAAAVYAIVSLLQESFTQSMARVFGAVVVVVGLLALVFSQGGLQVFVWGGNIVFLCYIVGWLLGDIFRPDSV